MRVMLTSCGLETKKIGAAFLEFLGKAPEEVHALFIPTAAIDADAIEVLPKCMNDLPGSRSRTSGYLTCIRICRLMN